MTANEDFEARERWAALVAAQASGAVLAPGDVEFCAAFEGEHPDAAEERELWSAFAGIAPPVGAFAVAAATASSTPVAQAANAAIAERAIAHVHRLRWAWWGVGLTAGAIALGGFGLAGPRAVPQTEVQSRMPTPRVDRLRSEPELPRDQPAPSTPALEPLDLRTPELDAPEPEPPRVVDAIELPSPTVPRRHRAPVQTPASDPEAMLRTAQSALAAGERSDALAAYRALIDRHPGSEAAMVARLTLAQLALADGEPRRALILYDAYVSGGGPLVEEAERGRIRAFAVAGRQAEEREAIATFLAEHPGSAYAEELRERAEQLHERAGELEG